MLNIGCHLSSSKGFKNMGENALKIGANTFQFFTRNPRGSKAKDIDEKDVKEFLELAKENNFGKVLAHAPYTLNPCSADDRNREFAIEIMKDDINRMEYIPNNLYNFHPGNHVKQGVEAGIEYIVYALNSILKEEQTTKVLLETMSGKGTEIGRSFEEIAEIIKGTRLKDHIGVCLDTCHIHDAGYDIVNELDKVLDEFDRVIGLDKLCAIHLNDSKNPFESHKDRHETIGEGYIGLDAISNIINHKKLCHLPFFLETPNELEGHKREIELLKGVYKW
ncbi:deoxyribonuclease IV [Clostridium algidicarnis]|uniref:deoxyribonuclease IV n=1 Tax=Clostridium algidicarnis TaxID=37659 RepID=UPI001C0AD7E2|nr:deoxyribonuclease IV [Clostridium algidicarnis]MBU3192637.1 deoxyribonuclease IV [Clostridium algidicarnis]